MSYLLQQFYNAAAQLAHAVAQLAHAAGQLAHAAALLTISSNFLPSPNGEGLCRHICSFVCLSLTKFTENSWLNFYENFQSKHEIEKETA